VSSTASSKLQSLIWLVGIGGLCLVLIVGCQHPQSSKSDEPSGAPSFEQIHKIDVHAHIFEGMPLLSEMMRRDNVTIINVCNRGRDGHLETMHRIAREMYRNQPDLYPFASCFDLTRIEEPDYSKQIVAWLDGTFRDGAVMVKIWKGGNGGAAEEWFICASRRSGL